MAYIRCKKISGGNYAYLVESSKTTKGPRQKVKKYLGKVYEFEGEASEVFEFGDPKNKKGLVGGLVQKELSSLGFVSGKRDMENGAVSFNSAKCSVVKKNGKPAVVRLNEGYLCDFTLRRIMNFKKSDDVTKDAHLLAKHFIDAGLVISEEDFVNYYQML